ncbi:MAG: ABC transporter permease [Planctomycetaceae bacterium]|nr:ABC transporter permease [Planctomycetaceae bacterium]
MIAGPLLHRQLLTTPRSLQHYLLRIGFVAGICVLLWTAAHNTFGLKPIRNIGDIARFGSFMFGLICSVQLAVVTAASLLLSAGSVAQEKDRRTLIMLLMTDLRSSELVIGKALASLVSVFTLIAISAPVLVALTMLGGISLDQILWFELLCVATAIVAAAWGTLVAYWRDKTFQTLAITVLGAGLFVGVVETLGALLGEASGIGPWLAGLNPFRTLGQLLDPLAAHTQVAVPVATAMSSCVGLFVLAIALFGFTCWKVRIWNPSRNVHIQVEESPTDAETSVSAVRSARDVWERPLLWREVCTEAYGRRVGVIKAAYYVFLVFCMLWVARAGSDAELLLGSLTPAGVAFVGLSLFALLLVNAQSVTSMTSERDGQTLELLLVTEVSAKEFIFSKLGGILFNTKEVIAVPLLFALSLFLRGAMTTESFLFTVLGYLTLVCFAAMLGLHSGLSYSNSRSAIMNSLGTMFFLFVGIFVCIVLIVEARASYEMQFAPFLVFIGGGSLALWLGLTRHNPSTALTICAFSLPFLTFYAIASFLLGHSMPVFISVLATYGFTTVAMLVPAISSFDIALGRSSLDRG